MAKRIKGVLLDVYKNRAVKAVEFEDTLEAIYELLDVDYIDVAVRKLGKHEYDFIVDDEGLYHEGGATPSVFGLDGKPLLVGNVLIVNNDGEGNFASLTKEQVNDILHNHVGLAFVGHDPVSVPVVMGAEYV